MILRCSFSNIEFPTPVGVIYTCYNVQVTNPNNSPVLENVLGTHVIGMTNAHVRGFTAGRDESTTQFPKNMHLFFPNLLGLEWYLGVLTSISANDLQFPSMQHLHLSRNRFTALDGDLLQHMPRLARVSFYSNLLQNVGYNFLNNLNALISVDFLTNLCINIRADDAQAINNLKSHLANQCPPLLPSTTTTTTTTTTTPVPTTTTSTTPITTTTSSPITTTENSCPIRCTIDEEVDELRQKLAQQDELNLEVKLYMETQHQVNIALQRVIDEQGQLLSQQVQVNQDQNSAIIELIEINALNVKRIIELEIQMRELMVVP